MTAKHLAITAALALARGASAQSQNAQDQKADQHDTQISQQAKDRGRKAAGQGAATSASRPPPRLEDSLPLASEADRAKSSKILQQSTVDLLTLFNDYKQAHWNLNGPLYISLHEYYQTQADAYRRYADLFAGRNLQLGYSVDGRYSTIAKTSSLPEMPGGYVTDNESLKSLTDRVTVFQKEVYRDIRATQDSDPPTSNKYQDPAYQVDMNLWQLRNFLQKPGGLGQDLPWVSQQGRDRAGS